MLTLASAAQARGRRHGPVWRGAMAGLALVFAAGSAAAPAEAPAPLTLRYDVYAAGLPVLTLDFTVTERASSYDIAGHFRATGIIGWLSDYAMQTESQGTVAAGRFHPRFHESRSHSRRRDRRARLDYAGDTIRTALSPATSDHPPPTGQQIAGTVDPLTALLTISEAVARAGHCGGVKVPVFDGRRRYDMALSDEGVEAGSPPSPSAPGGEVRRCAFAMTKIAGFSSDDKPHTDYGRVWFLPPQHGAPALPERVETQSDWGWVTVRLAQLGFAG